MAASGTVPRMARRRHYSQIWPLKAIAAILLAAAIVASIATAPGAASQVDSNRLWGTDRYETAAKTAEQYATAAKKSNTPINTVIVASGETFADALAATPLARVRNAPLLLTPPTTLHQATRDFIERHQIADIIVVGGTGSVSAAIEKALADLISGSAERLAGSDRYQTVVNIARKLSPEQVGAYCGDSRRTALVATGEQFADALALSPLAFAGPHPVLLTKADQLPAAVKTYLADYSITQVMIAGGPVAVAESVETELEGLGIRVQRWGGQDRYETAAEIATALVGDCFGSDEFGLTDGRNFPDALVGGTVLGLRQAPLLLSGPTLSSATRRILAGPLPDTGAVQLTIFGGSKAVSDAAAEAAADALRGLDRKCDPRTDVAGVPRDITVQPTNGGLVVRWKAPATVGANSPSGYRIRHRLAGQGWSTISDVSSPATIAGLKNSGLYEVQVRATGEGYGVWSPSSYAAPSSAVTAVTKSSLGTVIASLAAHPARISVRESGGCVADPAGT